MRIKIWNSHYAEAMNILLATLRKQGFDPDHPNEAQLRSPKTVDEVRVLVDSLKEVDYDEDSDVRVLLSTLICQSLPAYHVRVWADHQQARRDQRSLSLSPITGFLSSPTLCH